VNAFRNARKLAAYVVWLPIAYPHADYAASKAAGICEQFGPPSESGVSEGFRYWAWYGKNVIVRISVYSSGVSTSFEELR